MTDWGRAKLVIGISVQARKRILDRQRYALRDHRC
jgi:hypothetical protein